MDANLENRNSARINFKTTVMIETRDGENFHYATMYNFSGDGMYCESDFALKPGTAISVRLNKVPFNYAPKIYHGKIRRCEQLKGDDNSHIYGIGIKIQTGIDE